MSDKIIKSLKNIVGERRRDEREKEIENDQVKGSLQTRFLRTPLKKKLSMPTLKKKTNSAAFYYNPQLSLF